ncbi:transglutaminase domain-containing protein [candidate division WOR-3 bacterium]|nr:transglutaminase domain-containing protein [candidate division WOR-3 bacterium]
MKVLKIAAIFLSYVFLLNNCSKAPENTDPAILSIERAMNFEFKDQDEWLGLYIAGNKVGYSVYSLDTLSDGRFSEREFMFMNLTAGSKNMEISTKGIAFGSDQGYIDSFFYSINSEDQNLLIWGFYQNESLTISSFTDNSKETRTIPSDPLPLNIVEAIRFFGKESSITSLELFEPSTQEVVEISIMYKGIDTTYDYGELRHFTVDLLGIPVELWLDERDMFVKQEITALQMVLKAEPREVAQDLSSSGLSPDIYRQFRVRTDSTIENPTDVTRLLIVAKGLERDISSVNQTQKYDTVEIVRISDIPSNSSFPDSVSIYLRPSPLIQSEDPDIVEKSNEITRGIGTQREKLFAINQWVFENLRKEPTFTVPSSVDILKSMKGDCNEHSTLLCALLRASGIPARIAVGVVYANSDGFYYHAWCEAYIGTWISVDPTFGQNTADATHLTISRGNSAEQAKIMTVMGKLFIEIQEIDY